MKAKLLVWTIATIAITELARACTAADAAQLLESLRTANNEWQTVFSGLHCSAAVSVQRRNTTDEVFEFEYDQLRPDLWRLDIRRNGLGSLVRDGDFWFSVDRHSTVRYDRLGFDAAAIASIGASLQSQNTLLASSTHLLDIPLSQFVNMPQVQWKSVETPVSPESLHRLRWALPPGAGGEYLPAFGAIEWILDERHPLLTHYEYYFGKPDQTDPKGIVVDVSYDRFEGRLLPSRSTRSESGVTTETVRGKTAAAETDLAFYSPAAFGLARPLKPWQSYQVWALLGFGAVSVGIALRCWRSRSIRYTN